MSAFIRHVTRVLIAGFVALLPIGGLVLGVLYLESTLREGWLIHQDYYFPGLGILAAIVVLYLVGLVITTMLGRWLWHGIDALLDGLPALGSLYQTLKQVLGYGEGAEAMFQEVVLVASREFEAEEVGLVTHREPDGAGGERLTIFVPGAPNPATGRMLLMDAARVRRIDVAVSTALKSLVSVGATPLFGGDD